MQPLKDVVTEDGRYSQTLRAHQTLFREGETGDCAYIIESGRIEISRRLNGADHVLAVLGPGEIVGEMALIEDQPRSATAVALEPTVLRTLTREYLQERLQQSDPLLRHLLRRMSRQVRNPLGTPSGNPVINDDKDRNQAVARLHIAQAIQVGLDQGEFELHLQPVVHLCGGAPAGFEGLIRWNRPGFGYVPPSEFIPLAEESNLIMDIGSWTFDAACAHLRRLDSEGARHASQKLFIAVNVSARQFTDPRLFDVIEQALQKHGVEPQRLKLEITESALIQNFELAVSVLHRCRDMGFQLALDDFGTGYSSLSYLSRFPVHMLKIDRAFIKDVTTNASGQTIVHAIAGLGSALGMQVLGEGIESAEDAGMLESLGVGYGQGYHYGKAQSLERTLRYLDESPLAA